MASLPFLALRGVNIFADGLNTGIINTGAKVPFPAESGDTVTFGGTRGGIEIITTTEPCELTFSTKGIQPDVLAQFASGFGIRRAYTVLGALVDEFSADVNKRAVQCTATVIGRLSADLEKWEGGSIAGTEYTIKSVTKYTLQIGTAEVCRFDLLRGGWLDSAGLQLDIANLIGLNA